MTKEIGPREKQLRELTEARAAARAKPNLLQNENTPKASGTARKAPSGLSSGKPSRYAPQVKPADVKHQVIAAAETDRGEAEHSSRLPHLKPTDLLFPGRYEVTGKKKPKTKRPVGRPKVEGERPWEKEGIPRRTWYRRQADKAGK